MRSAVFLALVGCGFSVSARDPLATDAGPDDRKLDATSDGPNTVPRDIPHVPASHEAVGTSDIVIPNNTVIDTSTGTITPPIAGVAIEMAAQEPSGDELAIIRAKSIAIASGATVRVQGNATVRRPLVLLADVITIEGTLDGGGRRNVPGPGGRTGGGSGVGANGEHRDTYHDSGGGGGAFAVAASPGGHAGTTCGTQANGGSGGDPYGTPTLDVIVGGAAGGIGAASVCPVGAAGAGGGAIQISARIRIEISGVINVGGGGGGGGINCGGSDTGGGSGGGSGGALYVDTPTLVMSGALLAHGGGGGGGASGPGMNGGFGDNGLMVQANGGGSGGTYGTIGGRGATGSLASTNGGNQGCDGNGAGGGGSVGRIVIHTSSFAGGGTQSPAAMVINF